MEVKILDLHDLRKAKVKASEFCSIFSYLKEDTQNFLQEFSNKCGKIR